MINNREVLIFNGVRGLTYSEREIVSMVNMLDNTKYALGAGELSIVFLSAADMCNLHLQFCHDPAQTDVITFPGDASMNFAGEICVSPDMAWNSFCHHSMTFSEELSLYIVHGYLHLCGLDDLAEKETLKMREGENFCLDILKHHDLLPAFRYEHV